jgi:hypothetical protein
MEICLHPRVESREEERLGKDFAISGVQSTDPESTMTISSAHFTASSVRSRLWERLRREIAGH